MEKDDDTDEPFKPEGYETISVCATRALAKIQDNRATDVLLSRLASRGEENKHLVVLALGDLGDKKAVKALVGLLNDPDEWIRNHSIISLGKLQDEAAFDDLAKLYLKSFEVEGKWDHRAEEALINISRERFENLLLEIINGQVNCPGSKPDYVRPLGRVATEKSIPTLFDLLSSEPTYEMAAEILSYRFGGTKDVVSRAKGLLSSANPNECAGALLVLWSNREIVLPDLKEFAVHEAWQVRKAVCAIYAVRRDSERSSRKSQHSKQVGFSWIQRKVNEICRECETSLSAGTIFNADANYVIWCLKKTQSLVKPAGKKSKLTPTLLLQFLKEQGIDLNNLGDRLTDIEDERDLERNLSEFAKAL